MRLICPNCSAQYEIDATLVPDEGRDVQCSNCGHTWFELPPPPQDFAETTAEADSTVSEDQAEETPAASTEEIPSEDDAGPSHAALAIAAASEDSEEEDDFFDPPAAAAPPPRTELRRPVNEAALDILKEEAEREMSKRRAPPSEPMETQTDMGLDEIRNRNTPSRALRARMAHLKEEAPEEPARPRSEPRQPASQAEVISQADQHAPRRDLLPDIDEINSTLKSTKKRSDRSPEAVAKDQKSFRRGFLTMTLLSLVLILAYAQAPAIARAIPGSESALIPYVDGANVVRDWIDGMIGNTPK